MGKVHSIIASITLAFLIALIVIVSGMILFDDRPLDLIKQQNQAFIYIIGFVLMMGSIIITRIVAIFQNEQVKAQRISNQKSEVIEKQNNEIVSLNKTMIFEQRKNNKQQAEYIDQIRLLNDSMVENTKRDNQTVLSINNLTDSINRFAKRITSLEGKIRKHDIEIEKLKK